MMRPWETGEAVSFQLGSGTISDSSGASCVLLPTEALVSLCREVPTEVLVAFGRSVGHQMGVSISRRVPAVESASSEEMVDQLGAEFAVTGLGTLAIEYWGSAMVFTVKRSPILLGGDDKARVDPGDLLLGSVLEGALGRLGLEGAIVPLARKEGLSRLLACAHETKDSVLSWAASGMSYGDVLSRLNQATGEA